MRLQGTTSKSHIVKNEIILKVLQFILKSVDKIKLFKRLFTMPSVYDSWTEQQLLTKDILQFRIDHNGTVWRQILTIFI